MIKYTIEEFLNKEFLQYSNYKVIQQIPEFHDTLSQTARKILWVVLDENRKLKGNDVYSLIYNKANYMHGDQSAINVWNQLTAKWANNINLIEAKANFGYRVAKEAAAARYAGAKYSKIAKLIFKDTDKKIVWLQQQEGKIIEPYFMLSTLPINILNGFNGIAVGFASSIIARDPKYILDLIKGILNGKIKVIPKNIPARLPYFKGKIESGDNEKQFIFTGLIKKGKATKRFGTLIIEELPPKWQKHSYSEFLNKLKDQGIIENYFENCIKNTFYFEIKVPIEIYNNSEDWLIDKFGLSQRISENLTFTYYSSPKEKEIRVYDNIAEYLRDWIIERLKWYQVRKNYILDDINSKINLTENRLRFIQEILDKKIIIERKKKKEIENQLIKANYDKVDNKYDYLLNMPLYSLTTDRINELKKQLRGFKKQYKEIEKTPLQQFWLNDLNELEPLLLKELEEKA